MLRVAFKIHSESAFGTIVRNCSSAGGCWSATSSQVRLSSRIKRGTCARRRSGASADVCARQPICFRMLSRARADAESARSWTQKRSFGNFHSMEWAIPWNGQFHGIWCENDVEFGDNSKKKLFEMQNPMQRPSKLCVRWYNSIIITKSTSISKYCKKLH